jgi:wobble nucleotide-excising tRNase
VPPGPDSITLHWANALGKRLRLTRDLVHDKFAAWKVADLSKTIVYVDDPISSLDSNHLFSMYSFVKNKLGNAHQLFISTHNYEFLNLIKDWLMHDLKNKSSFYVVERCRDNGSFFSCISNMPEELTKFKSEFHYLFSIIFDFYSTPKTDHYKLYSLPNLTRRFLEAYLGFKIPIYAGLRKKLPDFIKDKIKEEKVIKFLDQYSHNNSLPRSLVFPDFGECKECVSIVVDQMRAFDPDHFNYLVGEVSWGEIAELPMNRFRGVLKIGE